MRYRGLEWCCEVTVLGTDIFCLDYFGFSLSRLHLGWKREEKKEMGEISVRLARLNVCGAKVFPSRLNFDFTFTFTLGFPHEKRKRKRERGWISGTERSRAISRGSEFDLTSFETEVEVEIGGEIRCGSPCIVLSYRVRIWKTI